MCEWTVNPYDFANVIRDYVQNVVARDGFNERTVASLLCGNLQAKRDFVPGPNHGKPTIADNEAITTLAMILAYGSGQMTPFGFSGLNVSGIATEDWLRLVDLFRDAGLTDAELRANMGWTAEGEAIRRERIGSYAPGLPDLTSTYDPYGYTIVKPDPDTGDPTRVPATQTDILGEPNTAPPVAPSPAGGPTVGNPVTEIRPEFPATPTPPPVSAPTTPVPPTITPVAGGGAQASGGTSDQAPYGFLIAAGLALVAGYFIFRRS